MAKSQAASKESKKSEKSEKPKKAVKEYDGNRRGEKNGSR